MNIPQSSFPRIIIIGGGFAGLAAAKGLENKELQVVLIDKHNYHTFQPLLYQFTTIWAVGASSHLVIFSYFTTPFDWEPDLQTTKVFF